MRRRSDATGVLLLLCAGAADAGCGRILLGRVPPDAPDGGPDLASDLARDTVADRAPDTGVDRAADTGADRAPDTSPPRDAPPGTLDLPPVCTFEGWCWTHPLPTSDRFVRAFWVDADDLWLIGASGIIVRFARGAWSTIPAPTTGGLSAIWASASNDVWVAGSAGPSHWDGQAWSRVPLPTSPDTRGVNAIWGCAPDDVWFMGPVASHWDGRQLSYVDMPSATGGFRAVWGSACDDVWAGTLDDSLGSGRIAHWNGSAWLTTANRPAEQLTGTGADDVWSLTQGQLFRWNGLNPGTLQDSRTLDLFPIGAAAVGTLNDGHAISVYARNGATSSFPARAPDAVSALWGRSADDIWGFGARGVAAHWEGAAWTSHLPGWTLSGDQAIKVIGSGPTDLWAVVGSTLLHGDGLTWRTALTPQEVGGRIYDVWARAANDVWVLGGDAVIHRWNGTGWQVEDPPPRGATTPEMRAIAGLGPDDVWIVRGRNSVLHWDGQTWISRQPFIDNLVDIWAAGPDDVWVVGDGVSRWHGAGWLPPRIPTALGSTPFTAVVGTGPTDVWVAAGGYVMKVSDDYRDLLVAINSDWHAAALAPVGTGGIWVVFQDGTAASRLYRLTGIDPNTIGMALLAPAGLNDLWLAADGTLWAAGDGGALIRKRPAP